MYVENVRNPSKVWDKPQRCIKLIKSDSKDFYIYILHKKNLIHFQMFYGFHKNIKFIVFNIKNHKKYFLSSKSAY